MINRVDTCSEVKSFMSLLKHNLLYDFIPDF